MWKSVSQPAAPAVEPPRAPSLYPPPSAAPEPAPVAAPRHATLNQQDQATIGKSLVIKGEVTGSEALFIDGRVEGSINLAGNRVTIGRNGTIAANISAQDVIVLGRVRGNVSATDRVEIRNEGSLTGDVVAQRIAIEDGAYFKGGIDIRRPGAKANGEAKPEAAPVRTAAAATQSSTEGRVSAPSSI